MKHEFCYYNNSNKIHERVRKYEKALYIDGEVVMMQGEFVGNCRATVQGNDTGLVVHLFLVLWFKFE
jgi:hypothetical protein